MAGFWFVIFVTYFIINFFFSLYLYNDLRRFYQKRNIITDGDTPELISIHDKYKEFRRNDSYSYLRILIGLNFLFWPKFILVCFFTTCLIVTLG